MDASINIKDFILDVYRESELWNYYSDNTITKLDICKTNDCRIFIEYFFGASGKEDCMSSLIKDLKDLSDERCQHIVYVFLLGVGIYHKEEKLKERIDSQIDNYRKKYGCKSDVNFLFVWFLCCLFHDLGYVKEESDDINWDFNLNEIGSSVGIPKFYRGTTKKYLKYIKDKYKKIDHGIYSGITMFKSLCEIRHNKEIQNKIMWEKELIPIYNISSWVVLCHNIWLQEKETIDAILYQKYGLDSLIYKKGELKILPDKSPLFFFFCLIDSIEPIKLIKDVSLLDNIDILFNNSTIIITNNLICDFKVKYSNRILGLCKWLTPVRRINNRVEIDIK